MKSLHKDILIILLIIVLIGAIASLIFVLGLGHERVESAPSKIQKQADEIETTKTDAQTTAGPAPPIQEGSMVSKETILTIADMIGVSELKDGAIINFEVYQEANFTIMKSEGVVEVFDGSSPVADFRLTTGSYAIDKILHTQKNELPAVIEQLKKERQLAISERKSIFTLMDKGYGDFAQRLGLI